MIRLLMLFLAWGCVFWVLGQGGDLALGFFVGAPVWVYIWYRTMTRLKYETGGNWLL